MFALRVGLNLEINKLFRISSSRLEEWREEIREKSL